MAGRSYVVALVMGIVVLWPGASPALAAEIPRPNILLIVADDLGYSDIGAFGGEIETPNLDRLATAGVRMTAFYGAPSCSPSRAMLLTGMDSHRVGLGNMAETMLPTQRGLAGYEGHLNGGPTIAARLKAAGYATMMAGKWHLGAGDDQSPAQHGFDRSFALLGGAANHFGLDQGGAWRGALLEARYRRDGELVTRPTGVYSDDYFTDQMLGFLKPALDARQPFFAYLAFTAPHWPLQAPEHLIAKYRGRYVHGPAALRAERARKMLQLGLLSASVDGVAHDDPGDASAETSAESRARTSRLMAVYAAMVDNLDANVGRVLEFLRANRALDNTVVVFLSDNGAEGMAQAQLDQFLRMAAPASEFANIQAENAEIDRIGSAGSFVAYGPDWAGVSSYPFRGHKGFMFDGGIRTPALIAGPGIPSGQRIAEPVSVRDVMPTLLDLARIPHEEGGSEVGTSWVPLLGPGKSPRDLPLRTIALELMLKRGIREGDWKAVFDGDPYKPLGAPSPRRWMLFDLARDPGERRDLSQQHPERLASLVEKWQRYAADNGVYLPPETSVTVGPVP